MYKKLKIINLFLKFLKITLEEILLKNDISFEEGNYFLLSNNIDRKKLKEFVENNVIEKIDNGWRVVLNKEDKQKVTDVKIESIYKQTNSIPGIPYKKLATKEQIEYIHKGHLIAKMFKKYLDLDAKFYYKNNEKNIFMQLKRANLNSKKDKGQCYFELKVKDKIEKENAVIYYEIQAVFKNKQPKIPIGNRLLAVKVNDKEIELMFHVFIPNYDRQYGKISYETGKKIEI